MTNEQNNSLTRVVTELSSSHLPGREKPLELAMIAEELVTWLRAKGVQPGASCLIRDLAGQMWPLE